MQDRQRVHMELQGLVQGVGFRPFVYRLAAEHGLAGWVNNTPGGLVLEVEGPAVALASFQERLRAEAPPHAAVRALQVTRMDLHGEERFVIRDSAASVDRRAWVMPDLATCPQCLAEILDPGDRRFGYPFTNCTQCGPRYSIIEALPYDRGQTTMRDFVMCAHCRREYEDPRQRRFHAQPNACPDCGPRLAFWDSHGAVLAGGSSALESAIAAIRQGQIVAVKGLGGFHLLADAFSEPAVAALRRRKQRPDKPLAVMFPSVEQVMDHCRVSALERQLLVSAAAPIVLLVRRQSGASLANGIAPGNPLLGCLLPYTPLHHLLLRGVGHAVVATSGNLADEPICIDEQEALARLGAIADVFLVHDRPILRPVDDSVVRVMAGRPLILRRARGYAPLPVPVGPVDSTTLALGGHQKNTVAVADQGQVFLSQHLGDLTTRPAQAVYQQAILSLEQLYGVRADQLACDRHPDYFSSAAARRMTRPLIRVQHHHAHIVSCMAEHQLTGEVLGVAWDGSGYGDDGTIWGGEFLRCTRAEFSRVAQLRAFRLPGAEAAVREPRRAAFGLLSALYGESILERDDLDCLRPWSREERAVLSRMIHAGIHAPWTSSMGRLFDGVAALIGLRQVASFEGQAAMDLEFAAAGAGPGQPYPFQIGPSGPQGSAGVADPAVVDWAGLIAGICEDRRAGTPVAVIAARFHQTLIAMIVAVAVRIGCPRVVLSGGCFQNRYLTEGAVQALTEAGFRPYWHRDVPPNDGGLALGQAVIGAARWSGQIRRPGKREEARGCV